MFGRDPSLPIDSILGFDNSSSLVSVDEYLQQHQQQTEEALLKARENTAMNAENRRERYNETVYDNPIDIGSKVLTQNHVQGRNKMQDV